MTAEYLLQKIKLAGGTIQIKNGDRLRIKAPKGVLSDSLKKELTAFKPDLIRILRNNSKPYVDEHGILIIPFDSDPKYHWWASGQSVIETLRELNTPPEIIAIYTHKGGTA